MKREHADIAFKIPSSAIISGGRYLIYFVLHGLPANSQAANFHIDLVGEGECGLNDSIPPAEWGYRKLEVPARLVKDGVMHFRLRSDARVELSTSSDGVDRRLATLGVAGFYYCAESDSDARLRLMEALQLSDLQSLKSRPPLADEAFALGDGVAG